jgi:integrase
VKQTTKSIINSTHKQSINSVSSPSAPIGTRCEQETENESEIKMALQAIENMKSEYRKEADLALFLLETGCRVSEALNIRHTDIDSLGRVRIQGKKGSKNRIVYSPSNVSMFLRAKNYGFQIWEQFNRFHIYRVFKKYGIGAFFGKNKKMSITHYFRHLNAIIAGEIAKEKSEISQILGHCELKNTNFYIK